MEIIAVWQWARANAWIRCQSYRNSGRRHLSNCNGLLAKNLRNETLWLNKIRYLLPLSSFAESAFSPDANWIGAARIRSNRLTISINVINFRLKRAAAVTRLAIPFRNVHAYCSRQLYLQWFNGPNYVKFFFKYFSRRPKYFLSTMPGKSTGPPFEETRT